MSLTRIYRKSPVEVEVAGPITPENIEEVARWCKGRCGPIGEAHEFIWLNPSDDYPDIAQIGDFVVYDPNSALATHEGFVAVDRLSFAKGYQEVG